MCLQASYSCKQQQGDPIAHMACHLYGISLGRKRLKNAIFAVAALKLKKSKG
ncbi:unnamed protein product [Larinioides sclopetarius]|uniref:Uncharacterized protein n=1 Tax=Larinioides sclopetarius TaxID=280406 RepID=A0AAV1Z6A0_9ARAC